MSLDQKLATYRPSDSAIDLIRSTPILLLVGPTGAGKDSVKDELLKTGRYHHIVSHTTRPPRINHGMLEKDGKDYHFIDRQQAEKLLDDQAMIEAKIYSGNLYGTSVDEIQIAKDQGKIAMTDIEVQGVAEYKQLDPNVMAVFLLPPDFETWQDRLQRRYGDVVDAADYKMRLETALYELDQLLGTDYYIPVINYELHRSAHEIGSIVDSQDHTTPDAANARAVADQLAKDIKKYLAVNA